MSKFSRQPGSPLRVSRRQTGLQPPQPGLDFSCRNCGSPAVLLPRDLSGQGLVICDRCRRPVATLAAFRAYVERLAAGAQFCDHHLTACHSGGSGPGSSTGSVAITEEILR